MSVASHTGHAGQGIAPHLPRAARGESAAWALRDSEAKYRRLLDGVQDHAIFMLDPQGLIVSWNAGAERIKGYTADQIIGRSFACLFPREEIIRGRPAEILKIAAASGRHEEQTMRVRRNGSRFLANVTITALRDPAGDLRGFSEISRDLTESKESGARYRGLLEAAPDAMVVVDQAGKIVLLNVQAEKQFGYHRDELVGQQVKNIIPEGFAERLIADGTRSAADALAQQIGTGIELSGRRKDGTEFPIEIMLSPLESTEGILVTAAIRDITVRKAAERHLAQMEGRYRGLLEAAPDAMVVVDQAGKIVLLNVQAEKQFGYHRDELVGQQVKNIIPEGFAERLIADGTRSAADALAQQIGTGIELSGRRKDGTEFPIEIMLSPLESTEGILVTAAIRDISVRREADAALRRTSQLLQASQSMAQVGGWEVDPVGNTMFWTDETYRIHDTSPAEYTPTLASAIQFYAPESIPIIAAAVQEAIVHGTPFDLELELITAKDRRIWVHTKGTVTIDQGRTVKITGVFHDITEQRELETQLRQAQRLEVVGQLAGGIAHDFNNLLTAIRGYSELVRRNLGPKDRNRADLDQVVLASDRAVELTRQLLAFSRRQVLQPRIVDPGELVAGVAPMLRRLLGEHIELVTYAAPHLGRVKVDPSQFEQIIVNLAVNARDAMPEGGKLRIETTNVELGTAYAASHPGVTPGLYVALTVSDTGSGMSEAVKAHIFEPFFTTKEPGKGTGMGLATVYGIAQQSGGSIYLYSEPGHGTSFKIYLPRVDDEAGAALPVPIAVTPTGSETILLVEDEEAVRAYAARILSEQGYVVLEASGGAAALALVAAHPGAIDLLVTDMVMPGLQGHQLGEQLSDIRPDLRVLYVSGFTENSVGDHGVVGEGIAFLPKPYTVDALGRAVRLVLDKQT
jgi:PAS domain S-box-containing protein